MKTLLKSILLLFLSITLICPFYYSTNANILVNSPELKKSKLTDSKSYNVRQVPNITEKFTNFESSFNLNPPTENFKKNQLIVKFKTQSSSVLSLNSTEVTAINSLIKKYNVNIKEIKKISSSNLNLLTLSGEANIQLIAKELKLALPNNIEYAEPNYTYTISAVAPQYVPTETYYNLLWGLENKGQSINGAPGVSGIDINAEAAWDKTKGSSSVVVAVVDSGVDTVHPDLQSNIFVNTKEIPDNYVDDDKNGYIDDITGWDAYWDDGYIYDHNGHGTHCSGTIAAKADGKGIIGVAPNVKILPVAFLDSNGSGSLADGIEAIEYAKKMGAKVISCSWGGPGYSQALYDCMKNSTALFVCAAGNEGSNNDSTPSYPATYNLANIISVAAISNTGALASFSNYGVTSVDVAAPGVDILSTFPDSQYYYGSGTSMATPQVSGVAALVLSSNTTLSAQGIKDCITKSTVKLSSLTGKVATGGMVNAYGALTTSTPSDNDIPGIALSSTSKTGTLDKAKDYDDVYNLKLNKDDVLTLNLTGATGTDFDLYLYDTTAKTIKSNVGILAYSEKLNTSTETLTFKIPATGTYYIDIYSFKGTGSYTLTYNVKTTATAGTYQESSLLLNKTGEWLKLTNTSAYSGALDYAKASASSTLKFNGSSISLYSLKAPSQGIAKVTLDNVVYYVDLYNSSSLYKQLVFTKSGLSTTSTHTIKLEWTGLVSSSAKKGSTNTNVNIDQIIVK